MWVRNHIEIGPGIYMDLLLGVPFFGMPRAGELLAVDVRCQPTEEKFYNVNEPWSKDSAQCQTVDGLRWFILGLSHDILTTWSCIWARISG